MRGQLGAVVAADVRRRTAPGRDPLQRGDRGVGVHATGISSDSRVTRGLPYGPEIGHGAGARRCRVVRVAEWHGVGRLANPGERGAEAQFELEWRIVQLVRGVLDERQLLGGERKAQLAALYGA